VSHKLVSKNSTCKEIEVIYVVKFQNKNHQSESIEIRPNHVGKLNKLIDEDCIIKFVFFMPNC
jgi:hypothetical protein